MTLKEFQIAHRKYCSRMISKCGNKRNMESKECMKCALNYLDAQAGLEQYDEKARVSNEAPKFATLADSAVRKGLADLIAKIRAGAGESVLPVGARPVISGIPLEVVDHDTVIVNGYAHTMTLRFLMRDYEEKPFDSKAGDQWEFSSLREYLNGEFFGKLSAPLQEVILPVMNFTKNVLVEQEDPDSRHRKVFNTSENEGEDQPAEPATIISEDKVWIPSMSQMGFTGTDDIVEGDVLDAFDRELTVDSNARRMVVEYHGDEAVPKKYWLRSSRLVDNDTPESPSIRVGTVVDHMGRCDTMDMYEGVAMVVPMITIG